MVEQNKLTFKNMKKKNPKNVAAGKKAAGVRWATRHELLNELALEFGDDKERMDNFQFNYKTEQLAELVGWIRKYHKKNV